MDEDIEKNIDNKCIINNQNDLSITDCICEDNIEINEDSDIENSQIIVPRSFPKDNYTNKMNISESFIDNIYEKTDDLIKEWITYKKNKKEYITNIRTTLDKAIYGQENAKKQLERLIGQWINGKMEGSVIGFAGYQVLVKHLLPKME